jgi:hypothetical protein
VPYLHPCKFINSHRICKGCDGANAAMTGIFAASANMMRICTLACSANLSWIWCRFQICNWIRRRCKCTVFSIFAVMRIWSIFMAKLFYKDPCPIDLWFRIRVVSKTGLPEFRPPFAKISCATFTSRQDEKKQYQKFFSSSVIDTIQTHKTKVYKPFRFCLIT